jgi:hypothetical protein
MVVQVSFPFLVVRRVAICAFRAAHKMAVLGQLLWKPPSGAPAESSMASQNRRVTLTANS